MHDTVKDQLYIFEACEGLRSTCRIPSTFENRQIAGESHDNKHRLPLQSQIWMLAHELALSDPGSPMRSDLLNLSGKRTAIDSRSHISG